jgi:hypothetical protein
MLFGRRFFRVVLAILREPSQIPRQLKLSVAVAAYCSRELRVSFSTNWMLHFKALDIGLWAVEAAGIGTSQLLPTPLKARRPPDWVRIVQLLTPSKT